MEVVGGLAVDAALVLALLVLVELLEAVLGVGVVLDVIALVLLDVTLVLEGEGAAGTPATAEGKERGIRREACGQLGQLVLLGVITGGCGEELTDNLLRGWSFKQSDVGVNRLLLFIQL